MEGMREVLAFELVASNAGSFTDCCRSACLRIVGDLCIGESRSGPECGAGGDIRTRQRARRQATREFFSGLLLRRRRGQCRASEREHCNHAPYRLSDPHAVPPDWR